MNREAAPVWTAGGEAMPSGEPRPLFARRGTGRPVLRIGVCSSLSGGFLRRLVQYVTAAPSPPELSFLEGPPAQILRAASRRGVDVAFVYGEQDWGELEHESLWHERVLAALAEHHALAQVTEIPPQRLVQERLLVHGGAEEHDRQADLLRRMLGCTPKNVDCLPVARETLIELAALDFGVAVITGSALGAFHSGVVYRPVSSVTETRFHAIWKPGGGNPALGPFLASLRAFAERWSLRASLD
jgi:DNA-binding transcriptional LysR family regulator